MVFSLHSSHRHQAEYSPTKVKNFESKMKCNSSDACNRAMMISAKEEVTSFRPYKSRYYHRETSTDSRKLENSFLHHLCVVNIRAH
jgi:hypothetical protein